MSTAIRRATKSSAAAYQGRKGDSSAIVSNGQVRPSVMNTSSTATSARFATSKRISVS